MILQVNKNPQHDSSLQVVQPNHLDYVSLGLGTASTRRSTPTYVAANRALIDLESIKGIPVHKLIWVPLANLTQ